MNSTRILLAGPFPPTCLLPYLQQDTGDDVPPQGMEGGSILANLALARLSNGLPTEIVTCDTELTAPIRTWKGEGVTLSVIRRRQKRAIRDGYRAERALIHQVMTQSQADLYHAHWTYEYAVAGLTQSHMPTVVSVHDHAGHMLRWMHRHYLGQYLITRWVFRTGRHFTAVSPYVADYVSARTGRPTSVVPNVLSKALLEKAGREKTDKSDPPTIVTASYWRKLKNIETALRAFSHVRKQIPGTRYALIGLDCHRNGPAHRWAVEQGLADGVEFRGRIPYAAALAVIAGAQLLLHPSFEESFGMPVAEAMALGVPVIGCASAGGVRWLIDNGKCGSLVSGESATEMADVMMQVLQDPGISQTQSAAALERATGLCSEGAVLEMYEQEYRRVLNEDRI